MLSVIESVANLLEAITGVVALTFVLVVLAGVIAYALMTFIKGHR